MLKRIATAALTCAFFFGLSLTARADIGGRTTINCYRGGREVSCESPRQRLRDGNVLAGSSVEGTFLEAFVDAAQLLDRIYEVVKNIAAENWAGAAYEAYKAYEEALQLNASAGDKFAVEKVYVSLDEAAGYDRVTLTFDAWSDDDPFQKLNVAAPTIRYQGPQPDPAGASHIPEGGLISAIGVGPVQGGLGQKSGKAMVTLSPRNLPIGVYPIVFSIKEGSCNICLGIVHTIFVSTYKTCRLTPNSSCDQLSKRWSSLYNQLLDEKNSIYPLMGDFRRRQRARQRYCGPDGQLNPRFPPPAGCDNPDDDTVYPGLCPQYATGIASQEACDQLADIYGRINSIEAQMAEVERQIKEQKCCHETINPRGGAGISGRELNVTAPEAGRQVGKPKYEDVKQHPAPTHEDKTKQHPAGQHHDPPPRPPAQHEEHPPTPHAPPEGER
jgi:hypothetical protein